MTPITRQDIQNILQITLNRAMERVAMKQDVIILADAVRNLSAMHQHSQQLLKQSEDQRVQLIRRAVALEGRLATLENEIRGLNATVAKISLHQQPTSMALPAMPAENQETAAPVRYVYRPT